MLSNAIASCYISRNKGLGKGLVCVGFKGCIVLLLHLTENWDAPNLTLVMGFRKSIRMIQ